MPPESRNFKFALTWLLSLAPVGGVALAFFKTHPEAVAIAGSVWAMLMGFFAKVWKELEDEAVKGAAALLRAMPGKAGQIMARTYDWLAFKLSAWAPGYTRRYRQEMLYHYGQFNDKGLGLINANRLDLEKVYVDLAIGTECPCSWKPAAYRKRWASTPCASWARRRRMPLFPRPCPVWRRR